MKKDHQVPKIERDDLNMVEALKLLDFQQKMDILKTMKRIKSESNNKPIDYSSNIQSH